MRVESTCCLIKLNTSTRKLLDQQLPNIDQMWPQWPKVAIWDVCSILWGLFLKDSIPDITVIFVFLVLWLYSFDDHETHSSFGCCKIEILSLCLCRRRCFHHFWQHCIFEICSVSESFKGWISKILCKIHNEKFQKESVQSDSPHCCMFYCNFPKSSNYPKMHPQQQLKIMFDYKRVAKGSRQ